MRNLPQITFFTLIIANMQPYITEILSRKDEDHETVFLHCSEKC
jgi:hypothetical protein